MYLIASTSQMYGNMADAWRGLKTLTGQTKPKSVSCMITPNEQLEFSEKLNDFYCRFERDDVDDELAGVLLSNVCERVCLEM